MEEFFQKNVRTINEHLQYIFEEGERKPITMTEWVRKLDCSLQFNERNILTHAAKVSHDLAEDHATAEFRKYVAGSRRASLPTSARRSKPARNSPANHRNASPERHALLCREANAPMSINDSDVEEGALSWFATLGYASAHGPDLAPGEPASKRASYGDVVLMSGSAMPCAA